MQRAAGHGLRLVMSDESQPAPQRGSPRPGSPQPNPYPGTREFEAGEKEYFFGRRQEVDILAALVQARSTTLLFAQSGAGKSSLIHAGLIPDLNGPPRRKMAVLPVAGVGGGIPSRLGPPPDNVFAFAALYSLFPEAEPGELAGLRLAEGIAPLLEEAGDGDLPVLLALDQFEELFTHHVERWRQRLPFFEQLAGALEAHPDLHLLLSMREDFIAELTPFAGLLPGALRDRFRLERLRPEPALEAVRGPAELAGLPFARGVAKELVGNLRRAQAGRQDAAGATASGGESPLSEFVEPVHLQIVCQRLWQNLKDDQASIETADLQQFGDVDQALTDFYCETLDRVLEPAVVPEHRLRRWFDTALITPAQTRGLVYRGAEATEGLPNAAVDELVEAYLIRATRRGSDTWYELAHDRLVEPILADNRRWRARHLKPLTVAAEVWKNADRDPRKLYSGALLAEAQRDAESRAGDPLPFEREFLDASLEKERASLEKERAAARRRRRQLATALSVAAALALLAFLFYRQRNVAISRELAVYSGDQLTTDPELSLLLAIEAVERDRTEEAGDALRRALLEPQVLREWRDQGLDPRVEPEPIAERFSPGGRLVATRDGDEIVVWEAVTGKERWRRPAQHIVWSPAGEALAAGGAAGIEVWDTATWQHRAGGIEIEPAATLLALGPGGERVAIRIGDDRVEVRESASGELASRPVDHGGVEVASFSPGGDLLVTTGRETWKLWPVPGAGQPIEGGSGHDAVFDPSGERLAVVGITAVDFWKLIKTPSGIELVEGLQRSQSFKSVAFSREGELAMTGGFVGRVEIARPYPYPGRVLNQWKAHGDIVHSVAFDTAGEGVLTASQDRTAAVWTAGSGRLLAQLRGHQQRILDAVFALEPGLVLTSSPRTARLWQLTLPRSPDVAGGGIQRAMLAPDGRRLIVVTLRRSPGAARKTFRSTLWTTEALEEVASLDTGSDRVATAAFSSDDGWVAIAAAGKIHGLSLEGRPRRLLVGHEKPVIDLVFSPDGGRLLSTGTDDTVRLWDWPSERQLKCFPRARSTTVALSPDAEKVATSDRGLARIWTVGDGGETRCGVDPGDSIPLLDPDAAPDTLDVESVSFDSEGRRLVTASTGGMVRLWRTDGEIVSRRLLPDKELYHAVFSPDGRSVLAWGDGATAYLWRLENDSPLIELSGHGRLRGASFSRDGRLVLTHDGTRARAWGIDSTSGRPFVELPLDPTGATSPEVKSLSWSSDGLSLAVAWSDRVELYACEVCRPLDELIAAARQRLRERRPERPLTPEERRRYLHEN